MHLKVMQQMSVIPRSVGVPPLSDANFEQVLMTNAMTMVEQQQQMQQRHSATALAGLLVSGSITADGLSSTTLSPPIPLSQQHQQQLVSQQQPSQISFTSLLSMGEDDVRINNPLAGMGLSDEHYSIILQNLVNGERFTGMGMDVVSGGSGSGSGGLKRTIDDVGFGSDKREGKRSRFEVIE
jgi:osomolarity two-component system response regulator SKN7